MSAHTCTLCNAPNRTLHEILHASAGDQDKGGGNSDAWKCAILSLALDRIGSALGIIVPSLVISVEASDVLTINPTRSRSR